MKQDEIIKLRSEGKSYNQIIKETGCSLSYIGRVCRNNGLGENVIGNNESQRTDENAVAENIRTRNTELEYAGGYTHVHGRVNVRCRRCGHEFSANYLGVIQKNTRCPICKVADRELKQQMQDAERQRVKAERKERRQKIATEMRIKKEYESHLKICKVCGKKYYTPHMGRKTCSDDCRAELNRKHVRENPNKQMYYRDARVKGRVIDSGITLQKLIERDNNICHICGQPCDANDKWLHGDGETIICGDNYPSIDHVIPLAKGGVHSWENIKLAHRRCNYLKSDKV